MKTELNQVKHSRHLSLLYLKKKYPELSPLLKIQSFLLENGTGCGKGEVFFFFKESKSKTKRLQETKAGQKLYF